VPVCNPLLIKFTGLHFYVCDTLLLTDNFFPSCGSLSLSRRETLESLFEKEREKAGQEIMRVAAENEVILMSEMAKAGGKR